MGGRLLGKYFLDFGNEVVQRWIHSCGEKGSSKIFFEKFFFTSGSTLIPLPPLGMLLARIFTLG